MWYWIVVYKGWIKRKYTVQDYWTSVCGILSNASEKFCETKQVCQERGSNLRQAVYVEPSHQVSLTSHPSTRSSWRCQAYLWSNLRRDSRCSQSFPRECDPWCCDIHRARQEKDCDSHGCGVRSEETGSHSVRLWRLEGHFDTQTNGSFL